MGYRRLETREKRQEKETKILVNDQQKLLLELVLTTNDQRKLLFLLTVPAYGNNCIAKHVNRLPFFGAHHW